MRAARRDHLDVIYSTSAPYGSHIVAMLVSRVFSARSRVSEEGAFVGAVLFPVDLALRSLLSEGPSTEIVVCRKVEAGEP